jgi:hypothetical protein
MAKQRLISSMFSKISRLVEISQYFKHLIGIVLEILDTNFY